MRQCGYSGMTTDGDARACDVQDWRLQVIVSCTSTCTYVHVCVCVCVCVCVGGGGGGGIAGTL